MIGQSYSGAKMQVGLFRFQSTSAGGRGAYKRCLTLVLVSRSGTSGSVTPSIAPSVTKNANNSAHGSNILVHPLTRVTRLLGNDNGGDGNLVLYCIVQTGVSIAVMAP